MNFSYEETLTFFNTSGLFLSGIGTLILAIISVRTLNSFTRWKEENVANKKSQIAEEALDDFETSLDGIEKWLINANTWCIYSRQTNAMQAKIHEFSEEECEQFNKRCNEDPYEVTNFCRNFEQNFSKFISAKNKVFRLNEKSISQDFINLELILKNLPSKVMRLHHISLLEKEKMIIREHLETKAPDEIQELTKKIKDFLVARLHFS